jgi:hypothetical protein
VTDHFTSEKAMVPIFAFQFTLHDISILLSSNLRPVRFKSSHVFAENEEQGAVEILDYGLFTVKLTKLCHGPPRQADHS